MDFGGQNVDGSSPIGQDKRPIDFESVRVCERFRAGAILLHLVGTGRRPDEAVRHIRTIGKHVFQLSGVAMAVKGFCRDQIEPYRSPIA